MYLKIFIVTFILLAFNMLIIGIKLLFNKDAAFTHHSCALNDEKLNNVGGCLDCQIKEIANCTEKEN